MGLNNRSANVKYVRLKDGKFYLGKDLETPYTELEGTITKTYYKNEEYEGAPIRKFIMVMEDGDDTFQLSLNVESSSYSGLISFLGNVDVTKPLTLHPKMDNQIKDGKEISKRTILVSQNGKFAKSYFTKEDPKGLPIWNVVKVGNKKVIDKTDFLNFLEVFTDKLFANVGPVEKVAKKEDFDDLPEDTSTTEVLPWDE